MDHDDGALQNTDYGFAKLGVSGSVGGTNADAFMAASFADNFVILGGDRYAAQAGTLTIGIAFDFEGRGIASEQSSIVLDLNQRLSVGSSAGSVLVEQRSLAHDARSSSSDLAYRTVVLSTMPEQQNLPFATAYTVIVPFFFDQPVSILNFISVYGAASGSLDATAAFALDALNSYYWAGMTVRDATGALVAADLVSDSGTDWRRSFLPATAVPEPATAAMVAIALFMLSVGARRRS